MFPSGEVKSISEKGEAFEEGIWKGEAKLGRRLGELPVHHIRRCCTTQYALRNSNWSQSGVEQSRAEWSSEAKQCCPTRKAFSDVIVSFIGLSSWKCHPVPIKLSASLYSISCCLNSEQLGVVGWTYCNTGGCRDGWADLRGEIRAGVESIAMLKKYYC